MIAGRSLQSGANTSKNTTIKIRSVSQKNLPGHKQVADKLSDKVHLITLLSSASNSL